MRKKMVTAVLALLGLGSIVALGATPNLVGNIIASVRQNVLFTLPSEPESTPLDRAKKILEQTGRVKRVSSQIETTKADRPGNVLWYVLFDFTMKIQAKAAEMEKRGESGSLFSNYFVRQGPLTPEEDLILKEIANRHFVEIDPVNQRAKAILEILAPNKSKANLTEAESAKYNLELRELQRQRDEITLRYKNELVTAFGENLSAAFETFLKADFSAGSKRGTTVGHAAPEGIFYDGYSWIIWDDTQQPPLITGFSELYFTYFDPVAYYDPSLDSAFLNLTTQTLLDFGRGDGYRDWFPAQYAHPVFTSTRGHHYCTYTDHYAVLYDGPFPIDKIYLDSTGVCHTVGPAPPTPTPTPTPCDPLGGLGCQTPTPTPTPAPVVTSVTFMQVTPSTEGITPNPTVTPHNPGIGERIFPDDDFPEDTVDRRRVLVTATISPPLPDIIVHFRNFDLDDPATDPTIDPNGSLANDNNGDPMPGTLSALSDETDATGVASVEFTVTRQPGDNFAIAASTIGKEANEVTVSGIELVNSSGGIIPTNCVTDLVCRSQMLTVWRRLHIEVDSMGLSDGNFVLGTIAIGGKVSPNQTRVVTVNPSPNSALEVNRFEGGRLAVGIRSLRVESNTADTVTVRNMTSSAINIGNNVQFQLYDDDDFNDNNSTALNGDTGENIPGPDDPDVNATALLQSNDILCSQTVTSACNVLASSYVRPIYDITSDTTDDGIFQANIEIGDARGIFLHNFDQRATENSQEYWTVVLYGAYQGPGPSNPIFGLPPGGLDGDPPDSDGNGNPNGCPEVAYGQADRIGPGGLGAGIFMEVLRPREYPSDYANLPLSPARTAAHEIGHLFGGDHQDGGLMAPSCGAATLATGYILDPLSIVRLRRDILNP